jgi:hypothetical protein
MDSKYNQNSRQNRLTLSESIHNKTQNDFRSNKNIFISQVFKKLLYPKLEKVKTCDVVFIASNRRKNSKDSTLTITESSLRFKHKKTSQQFPMSPQLRRVYNIINNNMQIKEEDYSIKESCNNNKRNRRKNKNTIDTYTDKRKKTEKNKKKKYTRCVSCSSSLYKKDIKKIKDITIVFNFKDKHKEKKDISIENKGKRKKSNKKKDKDSDISESTTTNNNISEYTHYIKNNSKKNINFRNDKNSNLTKSLKHSYVNKDMNELTKIINNQMKKNNPIFNKINMRGIGIQLLGNYMENNQKKKYKEMKLSGCNINDNDFCLLVKSLIDNEIEIPTLHLSYNKISDNSAKYLFEIIKKKTCLKNIYLYNNNFSKNFIDKIKNYSKDKNVDNIKLYT